MSDPLTDPLGLYQLEPAGFEIWMPTSGFQDYRAAWFELIRIVGYNGDYQAFLVAGLASCA